MKPGFKSEEKPTAQIAQAPQKKVQTPKARNTQLKQFFTKLANQIRKLRPRNKPQQAAYETSTRTLNEAQQEIRSFPPTQRKNKDAERKSRLSQQYINNRLDQQLTSQSETYIPNRETRKELQNLWNQSYSQIAQEQPGQANKTARQCLRKCDSALAREETQQTAQAPQRTQQQTETQTEQAPTSRIEQRRQRAREAIRRGVQTARTVAQAPIRAVRRVARMGRAARRTEQRTRDRAQRAVERQMDRAAPTIQRTAQTTRALSQRARETERRTYDQARAPVQRAIDRATETTAPRIQR
jgi:hypothetical protein